MDKKTIVDISFVGESSDTVTGSMIHLKTKHREILLECGLYQDSVDDEMEYVKNSEKFDFNPRSIDYVFICHNHTDHLGLLPRLFKEKSFARVIMPNHSYEIAEILLRDCAKIMRNKSRDLTAEKRKQYNTIYDSSDVDYTLSRVLTYPIGKRIYLDEYVSFRFVPSGHIMNSCQLELFLTEDGETRKILYTSDLGNTHIKKDYANEFSPVQKADIVIGESTYGNTSEIATDSTRKKDLAVLKKTIDSVIQSNKGNVLIPVFANDRCQTIMTELYKLYSNDKSFKLHVYIDSPMAANICDVYYDTLDDEGFELFERVCDWHNMHIIYTPEESRKLANNTKSKVILASSGMLDNGKANQWFSKICQEKKSHVIFCGYAVEGTLASKVKKAKEKNIEHEGKKYTINCNVVSLESFSSHMQQDSLIKYYSSIHTNLIYLVHGESEAKKHLAKLLNKTFVKNGKETSVVCASKGMKLSI